MIFLNYVGKIDYQGAYSLLDHLSGAKVDGHTEVVVTIASPGGITEAGLMLFHQISAHPLAITTHNVGCVDSAAFSVFLAGKNRVASPSSCFMIHLPKKGFDPKARFNANDLTLMAQDLLQQERALVSNYSTRMTAPEQDIRQWLTEGKRFSAEEALAAGIVSSIQPLAYPDDAQIYTLGGRD